MKKIFWILSYVALFGMSIQPMAYAEDSAKLLVAANQLKNAGSNLSPNALSGNSKQATEKAPEQLLSELTQEIYWALYDWKEEETRSFTIEQKNQITDWQSKLSDLHQQVMADMNKLTNWINEKNLSEVIQQRQQDAINHINTEVAGLTARLNQMSQSALESGTEQQVVNALNASFDFFEGKQLKRKHQVFDGLSSVALTPDRVPAGKSMADFSKYKFQELAKNTDKAAKDFTDPGLLGTSDEVVINDFINAKAAELENDPVKIYHWVRNNIEWLPSFGAIQASDITLGSLRGNAFDQSSLLLALLRTSGVPSRYAYGTIEVDIDKFTNWVGLNNPEAAVTFAQYGGIPIATVVSGGVITKVQMEHIWVEAAIDFNPSRGAKNIIPDSWVSLDPSFKQYEVLEGLDYLAVSGTDIDSVAQSFVDSGTVNSEEGWIQGLNSNIFISNQSEIESSVSDYIQNNIANPTVGDVIGGRRTITQEYPTIPSSMSNHVVILASNFINITDEFKPVYKLAFNKDITGEILNPLELNFAKLNNNKLTLSFTPETEQDRQLIASVYGIEINEFGDLPTTIPAHLIKVKPQIALNNIVINEGEAMSMGTDLNLYFQIYLPTQGIINKQYSIPSGSYVNLIFGSGSISQQKLKEVKLKGESTTFIVEQGVPQEISLLRTEDILGDMYHMNSLTYLMEQQFFNYTLSLAMNMTTNLSPTFGTIGFEPHVNYLFGVPMAIGGGGVSANVYTTRQSNSENETDNLKFNQLSGTITSFLEHSSLEQVYYKEDRPLNAVSTMKAINSAMLSGQKLFITKTENLETVLSEINLSRESENEIRQAVLAGYKVITHDQEIYFGSWYGAGYIIIDDFTGDASYKITGGRNGGEVDDPFANNSSSTTMALANLDNQDNETSQTLLSIFFGFLGYFWGNIFLDTVLLMVSLMSILNSIENGCSDPMAFAYFMILFTALLAFLTAFTVLTAGLFGSIAGAIIGYLLGAILDTLIEYVAENCDEQTRFKVINNNSLRLKAI